MRSPGKALQRLRIAVDDDRLAALCREHRVELAVLFGSALTSEEPGDVDLAVGFEDRPEAVPRALEEFATYVREVAQGARERAEA